ARTAAKQEQGGKTNGLPKLRRLLGPDGKRVVQRACRWLGLSKPKKTRGAPRPSAASLLVGLVERAGVELFHASDARTFAHVPSGAHRESWPLRSQRFRSWLSRLFYLAHRRAPGGQGLSDALSVLEGMALHDGPEVATHLRVAGHQGKIYVDLADPEWRAVEIDATGWRVVKGPPVRFPRPRGLLPRPEPVL